MGLHSKASAMDHSEDSGIGRLHQRSSTDRALWGLKTSANNGK